MILQIHPNIFIYKHIYTSVINIPKTAWFVAFNALMSIVAKYMHTNNPFENIGQKNMVRTSHLRRSLRDHPNKGVEGI